MPIRGELATNRYIKHPAASTSTVLSNGWSIDAGSLILLDSNIHHLQTQASRPLVMSVGNGTTTAFANADALFQGITGFDAVDGDSISLQNWQKIPWDRRTAVRLGAFNLIADYEIASGEASIRPLKFKVQATIHANATTYALHAAATFGNANPFNTPPFLSDTVSFGGTGARTGTLTLTPTTPITRTDTVGRLRCRAASSGGTVTEISVVQAYLWVGWRIYGATAGTSSIDSITIWEGSVE